MFLEVTNTKTARAFIDLPQKLYKDDPNWICPFDEDIEAVFDSSRNPYFSHGACTAGLWSMNSSSPLLTTKRQCRTAIPPGYWFR